jgi:hypothetical protein
VAGFNAGKDLDEWRDRCDGAPDNPALASETVEKAEARAAAGWTWPVSGDETARYRARGIPYFGRRRNR